MDNFFEDYIGVDESSSQLMYPSLSVSQTRSGKGYAYGKRCSQRSLSGSSSSSPSPSPSSSSASPPLNATSSSAATQSTTSYSVRNNDKAYFLNTPSVQQQQQQQQQKRQQQQQQQQQQHDAVMEDIDKLSSQMIRSDLVSSMDDKNMDGVATSYHGDMEDDRYDIDTKSEDITVHSQNLDLQNPKGLKNKLLKDKTCLVCGDKALGYNFNAVSCESCKAFFRRNAFKEIRGRCQGTCDVTVESRSYCKKCRLKKCFTVGMKKDLILNDNQKYMRRQKIHENRMRRQGLPYEPLPPPPPSKSSTSSPASQSAASPKAPATPPAPIDPEKVTHEMTSELDDSLLDEISDTSKEKIKEVMHAFKLSFDAPVDHSLPSSPSGVEFLNLADASVRRLVKMAKHLTSFRALDQEDQISLLKGSVVEVLILRSTKMFNVQNHSWMVKKGDTKATVQAEGLQTANLESMSFFKQYQRFTTTLLQTIRNDNIILMLIIVLTVLSPDRVNLKTQAVIESTQEEYAMILKEYCEKKYPNEHRMFAKVLQKLADIRDINETHTKMLIHMKVEELQPLIVEIFDISS